MANEMEKIMNKVKGTEETPAYKGTIIRIPYALWKRLRELQTEGKIKSIQRAAIDGLNIIAK